MKRLLFLILCLLAFESCSSEPVPTDQIDYVGMYEFRTAYPIYNAYPEHGEDYVSTNHDGDCLILKPSGEYVLMQGGTTKAMSETRGLWQLYFVKYNSRDYHSISLDSHGYPIRVKNGIIRLLIDDDLEVWYEKVNDSIPSEE